MSTQPTPPLSGPRPTLRLGACASLRLALVFAGMPGTAAAAMHLQIQGGRSYMDSSGANAAFVEATLTERPIGSSRFTWAPDISAGWIDSRCIKRFRHSTYPANNTSWVLAVGLRLRAGSERDWYHPLFFSFQPALHEGTTVALSSAYQFVSTIGWQGSF